MKKELLKNERVAILETLEKRFEKNLTRHKNIQWADVLKKITSHSAKLWVLNEMEKTGGEPDVIGFDKKENVYFFVDCAAETPKERRSICYDSEALASRKVHKPKNSAINMATEIGIELLTEEQYHELQKLEPFDAKTSSWVKTPNEIRKLGGAIFCDFRYGQVFTYHNGAESYYASRGFRGILKV